MRLGEIRQALDKVWFTCATPGGWTGIEDSSGAIQ